MPLIRKGRSTVFLADDAYRLNQTFPKRREQNYEQVMIASLALCGAIAVWGIVAPESMTGAAQGLVNYTLEALDWFYLLLCTVFLVIMFVLAVTKYGDIKLGHDDEVPEFSAGSWIAMLFAAGLGSG